MLANCALGYALPAQVSQCVLCVCACVNFAPSSHPHSRTEAHHVTLSHHPPTCRIGPQYTCGATPALTYHLCTACPVSGVSHVIASHHTRYMCIQCALESDIVVCTYTRESAPEVTSSITSSMHTLSCACAVHACPSCGICPSPYDARTTAPITAPVDFVTANVQLGSRHGTVTPTSSSYRRPFRPWAQVRPPQVP